MKTQEIVRKINLKHTWDMG